MNLITLSTITKNDLINVVQSKTGKSINQKQFWEIVDSITEQITDNLEEFIDESIRRVGIEEWI